MVNHQSASPVIETKGLSVGYGRTIVLHGVDMKVCEGEIVILMGPNGAGKSTLLKALFGLIPHTDGSISFLGKRCVPNPFRMVQGGAGFVPQGFTIFSSMTVKENLLMGAFYESDSVRKQQKLEEVLDFFPLLRRKYSDYAFAMSGGERQILALARALMTSPKLLLLDEPSVGLAPQVVQEVFSKIEEINTVFGTSLLIVEHNLKSLLQVAHRGYILVSGRVVKEGAVAEVSRSDVLESAFFGDLA